MNQQLKFPINEGNLYILLWCVYNMQGILYTQGSIISQGVLAILLIVSLINLYKLNTKYKLPIYFKGLNALLLMLVCYGIIYIISGETFYILGKKTVGNLDYLKDIFISILPIYSYYLYSIKKKITQKHILFWSIIFIGIAICRYWFNYQKILEEIVVYGSNQVEITNNVSYTFLAMFPLIFFWYKKPIIQYILLGVIMFFIISGMKRGAIIIGVICTLWFMYRTLKNISKNKKFLVILLCLTIIYIAIDYIENILITSSYFNQRVEDTIEGNSSGRDELFSTLFNYILYKASALQFIFGSGANYTIEVAGNYAHNDWLELAVNQGVIGVVIYIIYWLIAIKNTHNFKSNKLSYSVLVTFFIIYFISTMFSMSYNSMSFMSTLALGYCFANSAELADRKKIIINSTENKRSFFCLQNQLK